VLLCECCSCGVEKELIICPSRSESKFSVKSFTTRALRHRRLCLVATLMYLCLLFVLECARDFAQLRYFERLRAALRQPCSHASFTSVLMHMLPWPPIIPCGVCCAHLPASFPHTSVANCLDSSMQFFAFADFLRLAGCSDPVPCCGQCLSPGASAWP
jgi:hypothetical protein